MCGARLSLVCPACGAVTPLSYRFCDACGVPLSNTTTPKAFDAPPKRSRELAHPTSTGVPTVQLEGERRVATIILADIKGSQAHDIIEKCSKNKPGYRWQRPTNRAGGIEGGISNGENLIVRAAIKPIATLGKSLPSIDMASRQITQAHYERSDICVVPAAGVIGEAMLALVLADVALEKFGGDSLTEIIHNYQNYRESLIKSTQYE